MGDAQPHAKWPDGSTFDFCIERLGTSPGEMWYPVGAEWKGDDASWTAWKILIRNRYAPNEDIADRKVRDAIRAKIYLDPEVPYYDAAAKEFKFRPTPFIQQ